jgi:queuine tRNA-ribosyltransferase
VPGFDIHHRDPASRARTGTLRLAHGDVRTPAFVPLATKAVVKTLEVSDAAELGYDMVLGNTFHLFLSPGHELIRRLGGLHRFMRWERPVITDSGGFQVFSMGHGTVADEIKGRQAHGERTGSILEIAEEGVRFRSYLDGSERFMAPETSMEVQAALHSDIALVFDECTPFNVTRDYTARSTERTHRWLDRCLAWHARHGPGDQLVYGIVQGGVEEDLRRASAQAVAAREPGGIAIGGTLGEDKPQMYEVVEWAVDELGGRDESLPRHLLGIGEIDDLLRGVELGIDTFDCAMPTRIGRHGMAIVPDPAQRWRVDLAKGRHREADEPVLEGCPCPACARGYSRAYLHYLLKGRESTASRLLTIHNLAYVQMLMAALRDAIAEGRLGEAVAAVRGGAAPWELSTAH